MTVGRDTVSTAQDTTSAEDVPVDLYNSSGDENQDETSFICNPGHGKKPRRGPVYVPMIEAFHLIDNLYSIAYQILGQIL